MSWLLGCQFHVGVVPGASGAASVVAGIESAVRAVGALAVDEAWSFRVPERADLVVAGIGGPGRPTTIDELAEGLATACEAGPPGRQDRRPLPCLRRARPRSPPDRRDRGPRCRPRPTPGTRGRLRLSGRPSRWPPRSPGPTCTSTAALDAGPRRRPRDDSPSIAPRRPGNSPPAPRHAPCSARPTGPGRSWTGRSSQASLATAPGTEVQEWVMISANALVASIEPRPYRSAISYVKYRRRLRSGRLSGKTSDLNLSDRASE